MMRRRTFMFASVGESPTAQINHPGDQEERKVNQDIPFIGVANDAEDGALGGNSMVWTSSEEGQIGTGENFQWAPSQTGWHIITLTATDSDDNTGEDTVEINVIP